MASNPMLQAVLRFQHHQTTTPFMPVPPAESAAAAAAVPVREPPPEPAPQPEPEPEPHRRSLLDKLLHGGEHGKTE